MEILLVRHARAGKPDPERHPDDDLRPITEKGAKGFRRAARALRALEVEPARIWSSPALRTLETARLLAKGLGLRAREVSTLDLLHHSASPAAALRALGRLPRTGPRRLPRRFALVGHEPWLGEFLSLLVSGSARAKLPLAKGGACLIETDALSPGAGTLRWLLTQEQLEAIARR